MYDVPHGLLGSPRRGDAGGGGEVMTSGNGACFDLAKLFLVDAGNHSDVAADRLAQEIQDVIDEFLSDPTRMTVRQS